VTLRSAVLICGVAGVLVVAAPLTAAPVVAPATAQTAEPATTAVPPGAGTGPDAGAARRPPLIDADAAAVYEPVTGDLVFAYRASRPRPIASTTKLMTAYVVLNREPLGRVFTSPGYSPVFSDESLVGLRAGERMTVADLLRGMLLASGNDAAVDLAVNTAGSVGGFVAEMNRTALRLGLRHTHYTTPIGLDSSGNYSSASDLVRLAAILRGRPWFARTVDRGGAVLHSNRGRRYVRNLNDLVRRVGFVNGVKTGHTPSAGYCLVGSATRNGVTVISAVLGDPSAYARNADTLALLRYGLSRYRSYTAFGTADLLAKAKVRYRESDTVGLVPARPFSTVVRRGERRPQVVVHAPKKLTGPLPAGRKVGYAGVVYRGRVIARVPLLTRSKVPEVGAVQRAVTFIARPGTLGIALLLGLVVLLVARRRRRGGRAGSGDHHRHTQRRDRQDPGGPELPARPPAP
jgi:serine-type D-Ala-D-Ala carboxypeptidase (penicillin-binding protein 5/6)